jgi:O-antigen ligase
MNLTKFLAHRLQRLSWSKRDQYIITIITFIIPFGIKLLPSFIILLGLSWLFTGGIKRTILYFFYSKERNRFFLFLIIFFYFFHLLSLLFTENLRPGVFDIEVKLSFLLIPLFLTGIPKNSIDLDKILNSFIIGTLVAAILCFFIAIWNSLDFDSGKIIFNVQPGANYWENFFLYNRFSVFHHPSYFAMFILFTLAIGFYYLKSNNKSLFGNRFILITMVFLSITLFLLSSRAGLLAWFILIITFGLTFIQKRTRKSYRFAIPFVILLGVFSLLLINISRYNNVKEEFKVYENYTQESLRSSIGTRIVLWEEAVQIIKRNFFLGVGQGDIKMELHHRTNKKGYSQIVERNYNIHNQFLETFVGLGIGGIILLVLMLFGPILRLSGKFLELFIYFIIIITVNLVFESMFNLIAGVFFFAFFYCLFILFMNRVPKKSDNIS